MIMFYFSILCKSSLNMWRPGKLAQVDKECRMSVHFIALLNRDHNPWSVTYIPLYLHFLDYNTVWSVNKPGKSVKEVLYSSTLLYLECKTSAHKWQTSDHFWSTWVLNKIIIICLPLIWVVDFANLIDYVWDAKCLQKISFYTEISTSVHFCKQSLNNIILSPHTVKVW